MDSISFKSDQSQGNRLSIHLDAVGGISGDMFASAFLDLNPELMVAIKESVDEIGLGDELRVENKAFSDGVLKGQRFLVDEGASESSNHTPWKEIRERLIQSRIKQEIRESAIGIFKCLAEAEALVHGIDVEEVVFHEVGAVDSMVDVLAASVILDAYHEANWFLGSLPLGRGEVQTAHGKLPLP
ncbi:MAG: nickel insertion protein, partial [SAR324 cluster bacterium]|nr:nickel insertion protein [SAR324 cluster bacterium]